MIPILKRQYPPLRFWLGVLAFEFWCLQAWEIMYPQSNSRQLVGFGTLAVLYALWHMENVR